VDVPEPNLCKPSMNKQSYLLFIFLLMLASYAQAQGGHGPSFTLATPTLPKGNWNFDLTLMSLHHARHFDMD